MSRCTPRCRGAAMAGWTRRWVCWAMALLSAPWSGASAQSMPVAVPETMHASSVTAPDSTWLVQEAAARACLDTLSEGSLRAVTVYQTAMPSDTSRTVLDEVALISEHIGERVRAALGNGPDSVSTVDTLVAWRYLAGRVPVRIVLHREAATTWSIESASDTAKAKLATFYAAVLRTMPADELEMVWPEYLAPDSLTVYLALSTTESSQRPQPRVGYPMMSVFRTRGIAFRPAMVREDNPTPAYPLDAEQQRIEADVIVWIIVRPSGFADETTKRVVLSSAHPIGSRARGHFAQEFTSEVEHVIKRMRFLPARAGGCAVPQQADFPFTFRRG